MPAAAEKFAKESRNAGNGLSSIFDSGFLVSCFPDSSIFVSFVSFVVN